jgi:hypothetical protein
MNIENKSDLLLDTASNGVLIEIYKSNTHCQYCDDYTNCLDVVVSAVRDIKCACQESDIFRNKSLQVCIKCLKEVWNDE